MRRNFTKLISGLLLSSGIKEPPIDVRKVAQTLQVSVNEAPSENPNNVSFLLKRGSDYLIGLNSECSEREKRWAIACNLWSARQRTPEVIQVQNRDSPDFWAPIGDQPSESTRFALALILPETFLRSDTSRLGRVDLLADPRPLAELASRYKVSTTLLLARLDQLLSLHPI